MAPLDTAPLYASLHGSLHRPLCRSSLDWSLVNSLYWSLVYSLGWVWEEEWHL